MPKAVVQIVHGISEYVGRYDAFARWLADHGYLVCGEDHLGHGHTVDDEKFGFVAAKGGWELMAQDVRRLRELMAEQRPNLPYFMLGHSMGSFLARTYLIDHPGTLTGVILSGTGQEASALVASGKFLASLLSALKGPEHRSKLLYILSMGSYNKKFAPNRTASDWISRDEAVVDRYRTDELSRNRTTVTLFRDMMGGLQYIGNAANLKRMDPDTPVYFFSGDCDPVGDMGKGVRKVCEMFRTAGCRDVELKLYPGGRHEMLNELNRQEVWDDTLRWLEKKI